MAQEENNHFDAFNGEQSQQIPVDNSSALVQLLHQQAEDNRKILAELQASRQQQAPNYFGAPFGNQQFAGTPAFMNLSQGPAQVPLNLSQRTAPIPQNSIQTSVSVPESEEPEAIPPLRKLTLKPTNEVRRWKREGSGNRYQYDSMVRIAEKLNQLQETAIPDPAPSVEIANAWNQACATVSSEVEHILMAEDSPHGWALVRELETVPVTSDPQLQKRILEATKALNQREKGKETAKDKTKAAFPSKGLKRSYSGQQIAQPQQFVPPPLAAYGYGNGPFGPPAYGFQRPPMPPPLQAPAMYGYAGPSGLVCYTCNTPGHKSTNCPQSKK